MLIDSHCHLDRLDLSKDHGDLGAAIERARANGVQHMLCVSIDLESWPHMAALVEPFADVSISVGVHPNDRQRREPTVAELVALAERPRVVAIGETGLDYFRSEGDLEWQRARFRTHIRAARTVGKPLIVHSRDAKEDTLRILEEEGADAVGGVMHCFAEDWDMAERSLALGFYISFSGIVTFRSADALREVARRVPGDRILIETDSPYLAPVPHRGKPNEPALVREVAACIAQLRGVSLQELGSSTSANFRRLFHAG
ncbi:MAG TPA: TatD family deoxyribonuclease [Alphaproteobacteria bacterium]|nr:TatD family deoxyribonuclease [Alphaproteobacteria bacterium]